MPKNAHEEAAKHQEMRLLFGFLFGLSSCSCLPVSCPFAAPSTQPREHKKCS